MQLDEIVEKELIFQGHPNFVRISWLVSVAMAGVFEIMLHGKLIDLENSTICIKPGFRFFRHMNIY